MFHKVQPDQVSRDKSKDSSSTLFGKDRTLPTSILGNDEFTEVVFMPLTITGVKLLRLTPLV